MQISVFRFSAKLGAVFYKGTTDKVICKGCFAPKKGSISFQKSHINLKKKHHELNILYYGVCRGGRRRVKSKISWGYWSLTLCYTFTIFHITTYTHATWLVEQRENWGREGQPPPWTPHPHPHPDWCKGSRKSILRVKIDAVSVKKNLLRAELHRYLLSEVKTEKG